MFPNGTSGAYALSLSRGRPNEAMPLHDGLPSTRSLALIATRVSRALISVSLDRFLVLSWTMGAAKMSE